MQQPPTRLVARCMGALLLLLSACTVSGTVERTPDGEASPTAGVEALSADQPDVWRAAAPSWALTLSWQSPSGETLDHYEILRDDAPLAGDVQGTTFRDERVDPNTAYTYTVIGVGRDGVTTRPTLLHVRTNAPATRAARLEGPFLVKLHVASSDGLTSEPVGGSLMFRYDPGCGDGACDVGWGVRTYRPTGDLTRRGSRYDGTTRGSLLLRGCHGDPIRETIEVQTEVLAAAPIGGTWRATRVKGSLRESGRSKGCAPASITWTFTGVIQT